MFELEQQQMRQLIEELNVASEAYYGGRGELLTDYEWDAKFDQLSRLERSTGIVLDGSPTQKVSEQTMEGQKEAHEFAALSLAKTKQVGDVEKWAEGKPVWISWKLDGLTLVATYDDGSLTKVVTRGNGHIGTNITHLSSAIKGLPQTIPAAGHVVVRGEAIISYDDFNRFLLETGADYANPRNLASGSLTLKDVSEVKLRNIRWIAFTLVSAPENIPSWGQRMDWLDQNGFTTVDRRLVKEPTAYNINKVIDAFTQEVSNQKNPFPVDGLVVAYDDTAFAQTGSVTGHHATRAGLAFKWQDEAATTELIEIEWSCAANTISPVAVFKPVELEGTTVRRASLCNISECERLGIGGQGSVLSVIKANKIIPKVVSVEQKVGQLQIPDSCPVCHHEARVEVSKVSGTKTLHCTNPDCPAKQLRKFSRFVSKEGMNIDGISEQTLAKFINLGWIREYADIYKLNNHIREIASLDGFGERSARNMMQAINRSRTVDARNLLIALSIPKCGPDVAKRLLASYSIDDVLKLSENTLFSELDLKDIDGIGPEREAIIKEWFRNPANISMLNNLLSEVSVTQPHSEPAGNSCEGLTFVITGDVRHFKNRNELKAYIESQGGKVTGSVSKSTSFLINNDIASTSGKNKKAQQLQIPIISEDDFIERFGAEN